MSDGLTQTKIRGKFYPLQHSEWLRACHELTPTQFQVLYFIRTLDPYDNGVEINCAEIARQLSTQKKTVHRQTISRALKELEKKGFIDQELVQVQVKVNAKGLWCDRISEPNETLEDDQAPGCDETPPRIATHHSGSSDPRVDRHTLGWIATHQTSAETQTQQESQSSKINKTYSDFINTLSEGEREKFEKYVREEWRKLTAKNGELGQEIVSLERFLAKEEDILNWYDRFLNSPAGKEVKKKAFAESLNSWRHDERFGEWIFEAYNRGYQWINEVIGESRLERKSFHDWAFEVNAFAEVGLS